MHPCKYILTLFVFLMMVAKSSLLSAQQFERRIIIEQDTFYAVELNPETQIGKLYIGSISEPVDSAAVYVLPAGARKRPMNPMPFSWTIYNDTLYCINATEYAQNTPINSLKLIPLKNLEIYDPTVKPTKYLLQAAYANSPIRNMPLVQAYQKYIYVDDLYYDLNIWRDMLYVLISVKSELTIWRYEEENWFPSEVIPLESNGFFWTFPGDLLHVVSQSGAGLVYPPAKSIAPMKDLSNHILIDNRDEERIYFVPIDVFSNFPSLSFKEILTKANN